MTQGTSSSSVTSSRLQTSSAVLSAKEKLREIADLSGFALRQVFQGRYCDQIRDALEEYERYTRELVEKPLQDARVLDVGFGARPWRAAALYATGVDVWGVDLDRPILRGNPREIATMFREDGFERTLKSSARHYLLDWVERRGLERRLGIALRTSELEDRLIVNDASEAEAWTSFNGRPFDLIVSEDVFEHVPAERLSPLCSLMAEHMSDRSVALVRPFVFTGISGGHLAEWFAEEVDEPRPRRAAPWEHLRLRRFRPNTYLNELRLENYRRIFSERFDILEEKPLQVDLGRQYLTPALREELSEYSEQELFANNYLFVLRKRRV